MNKISAKDYKKRLRWLRLKLFIEKRKGIADAKKNLVIKSERGCTTPEIQKKYAIILGEYNNLTEIMLAELSEDYEAVSRLVNEYKEATARRSLFAASDNKTDLLKREDSRNREKQREIQSVLSSYKEKILFYSENHVHEIEQIYAVERAKICTYWSGVLSVIKDLEYFSVLEIDMDNNEGLKLYKHNRDRLLELINSIYEEGGSDYELV